MEIKSYNFWIDGLFLFQSKELIEWNYGDHLPRIHTENI